MSDSEDIVTLDIYIIKSYLVFSCKMRTEYSRTISTEPMGKIYKLNFSSNLAGIVLDGNSVPWWWNLRYWQLMLKKTRL